MYRSDRPSHSVVVGYIFWIFGFLGAHRFYYGKQLSGTIYFFTLGLLLIGWIVDLFLIPGMNEETQGRFYQGAKDYNVTWLLFAFLGLFGAHRMYLDKWPTGILYLLTGGLFLIGWLYDLWTLNGQIALVNAERG
jgi:TM2 domain-containing membrane protein YozV